MVDFLGLVTVGVSAFAATNIDDIFILMLFFSTSQGFQVRQIVIGQYVGIGLLTAIGVLGAFLPLLVPEYVIGLLGIAPIAIGIRKLIKNIWNKDKIERPERAGHSPYNESTIRKRFNRLDLSFLSVAAVTFSNGADNIGVYIPMFAQYSSATQIITIVTVFMVMTAIWCASAYYFVNHPLVASRIRRIGNVILPFVLIGLGIYILVQSFL
jgi:cadmium resistance transport/sequestration family protein